MARKLEDRDYVYTWVDDVHFNVRLGDDDRLCCLVMVGVRLDGSKELIALTDGYRESTESWAELLRAYKKRGMRAPVVAVGDGALGFWAAVRDDFPETRPQRDWVHKTANVLDCLPNRRSLPPSAPSSRSPTQRTRTARRARSKRSPMSSCAKWPTAVTKIVDDQNALLTFYDFPVEHWKHLRTTNPIESTFAPVRARTNPTKGPGSREAGARDGVQAHRGRGGRCRKINGHELVALVRAGAKFVNGKLVEAQNDETDAA